MGRIVDLDYDKDTRQAYQDLETARVYKRYQTEDWIWCRFTTWRQQVFVRKALKLSLGAGEGTILDFPCGTGILGAVLAKFPCQLVAADISRAMMAVAREEYAGPQFHGFIQADITQAPFKRGRFSCVIVVGLMHRVPRDIRWKVLKEINGLTKRFAIISYSLDSPSQHLKKAWLKKLIPGHRPPPSPAPWAEVISDLKDHGLRVLRKYRVMPFFSTQVVLLLEKIP